MMNGSRILEGYVPPVDATVVSNVTGNPDLTIPVAGGDGMPVGMSIVGCQWDESTLIRLGRAYERLVGGFAVSPMAAGRLGA